MTREPSRDGARDARPSRAVLFDLDDTLYPERRFLLSGFAAVARDAGALGVPEAEVFRLLVATWRDGRRHEAFQAVCERFELPASLVARWIDLFRAHPPRLQLPGVTRRLLTDLSRNWALGIVTNGLPAVQRRKLDALGLPALVDATVLASEHGSGRGKPEPEAFLACLARLAVPPTRAVFVGDDPDVDVSGARAAGLRTVRVAGWRRQAFRVAVGADADIVVADLTQVPGAASRLVGRTPGAVRARARLPGRV